MPLEVNLLKNINNREPWSAENGKTEFINLHQVYTDDLL